MPGCKAGRKGQEKLGEPETRDQPNPVGKLTTRFIFAVLSNGEHQEVNMWLLPQGLNLGQGHVKDREPKQLRHDS